MTELRKLGAYLGVDASKHQEEDTGSQGAFDLKGYTQEIEDAAARDYSLRRGLEAAHLSGEFHDEDGKLKKNAPPREIGSIEDAIAAQKFFEENHEGGGRFSSNQDYANITRRFVGKDRDNLLTKMESMVPEEEAGGEAKEPKPYVMSQELANARNLVDQYELKLRSPGFNVFSTGANAGKKSDIVFDTRPAELGQELSATPPGGQIADTLNTSPLDNTQVKANGELNLAQVEPKTPQQQNAQAMKDKYAFKVKDTLKAMGKPTSTFALGMGAAAMMPGLG